MKRENSSKSQDQPDDRITADLLGIINKVVEDNDTLQKRVDVLERAFKEFKTVHLENESLHKSMKKLISILQDSELRKPCTASTNEYRRSENRVPKELANCDGRSYHTSFESRKRLKTDEEKTKNSSRNYRDSPLYEGRTSPSRQKYNSLHHSRRSYEAERSSHERPSVESGQRSFNGERVHHDSKLEDERQRILERLNSSERRERLQREERHLNETSYKEYNDCGQVGENRLKESKDFRQSGESRTKEIRDSRQSDGYHLRENTNMKRGNESKQSGDCRTKQIDVSRQPSSCRRKKLKEIKLRGDCRTKEIRVPKQSCNGGSKEIRASTQTSDYHLEKLEESEQRNVPPSRQNEESELPSDSHVRDSDESKHQSDSRKRSVKDSQESDDCHSAAPKLPRLNLVKKTEGPTSSKPKSSENKDDGPLDPRLGHSRAPKVDIPSTMVPLWGTGAGEIDLKKLHSTPIKFLSSFPAFPNYKMISPLPSTPDQLKEKFKVQQTIKVSPMQSFLNDDKFDEVKKVLESKDEVKNEVKKAVAVESENRNFVDVELIKKVFQCSEEAKKTVTGESESQDAVDVEFLKKVLQSAQEVKETVAVESENKDTVDVKCTTNALQSTQEAKKTVAVELEKDDAIDVKTVLENNEVEHGVFRRRRRIQ